MCSVSTRTGAVRTPLAGPPLPGALCAAYYAARRTVKYQNPQTRTNRKVALFFQFFCYLRWSEVLVSEYKMTTISGVQHWYCEKCNQDICKKHLPAAQTVTPCPKCCGPMTLGNRSYECDHLHCPVPAWWPFEVESSDWWRPLNSIIHIVDEASITEWQRKAAASVLPRDNRILSLAECQERTKKKNAPARRR